MDFSGWALYCDLDGSLLSSFGEVTLKSQKAINAFVRDGGLFGLCTGRATQNAFSRLPDVAVNAPSVVFNGAAVYDDTRKAYTQIHLIDKSAAMQAVKWCVTRFPHIDAQIYTPDEIIYASDPANADPAFLDIHRPCRFLRPDETAAFDWLKCLFFGSGESLLQLEAYVVQNGLAARMALVHSATDITEGAKYLELVPLHISKGSAIASLRTLDALKGRKIAGFGDYYNDIDFLQASDYAFAPQTALPEVKAVAYKVVSGNNDNPVCDIIEELKRLS